MITWSSVNVNHPPMSEVIIVQKPSGVIALVVLDSRHGIDWNVEHLIENNFTKWSDTE